MKGARLVATFSHRAYHWVLPSGVRLPPISVGGVPVRAGLPVRVYPPAGCFVVAPPPVVGGGRRGHVLPQQGVVLLSCTGGCLGEWQPALVVVVARVGGWFSLRWSRGGGVVIWIPPGGQKRPHIVKHASLEVANKTKRPLKLDERFAWKDFSTKLKEKKIHCTNVV